MYTPAYQLNQYVYAGPQPGFMKPEEVYTQHVILGIEAGSFEYGVGKHTGKASFGDLVFVPPGVSFKRKALGDVTFHLLTFSLMVEPDPIFDTLPIGKLTIGDVNRLSSTYSYLRKTWAEYRFKTQTTKLANHLLMDLLHMANLEMQYAQKRRSKSDPQMQQAAGHIHRHLFEDLRLRRIADKLGIQPSELTRRFRLEYGLTPKEYAMGLKLQEVKKLLLETNYTLDTIASMCGFENGSYLSRVFRSKTGINASEFRKNNQI